MDLFQRHNPLRICTHFVVAVLLPAQICAPVEVGDLLNGKSLWNTIDCGKELIQLSLSGRSITSIGRAEHWNSANIHSTPRGNAQHLALAVELKTSSDRSIPIPAPEVTVDSRGDRIESELLGDVGMQIKQLHNTLKSWNRAGKCAERPW